MQYKETPFFELRLYIGSVRGYKGPHFSEAQVTRVVQDFQTTWKQKHGWTVALRFSKTNFVCMDYTEPGWELSAINYPRFPRAENELEDFMSSLQDHLMIE